MKEEGHRKLLSEERVAEKSRREMTRHCLFLGAMMLASQAQISSGGGVEGDLLKAISSPLLTFFPSKGQVTQTWQQ